MRVRLNSDGGLHPAGLNADPHYGELVFTDWDSGATPDAEVLDGTGCAVGLAYGVTQSATNGTLTVTRAGVYEVALYGHQQESADADEPTYAIQKNGSALRSALHSNGASGATSSVLITILVSLAVGDVIRAVVTDGSGGDAIADFNGVLRVLQISDAELSV